MELWQIGSRSSAVVARYCFSVEFRIRETPVYAISMFSLDVRLEVGFIESEQWGVNDSCSELTGAVMHF